MTANAHRMADGRSWTAHELCARIRAAHVAPEWAVFFEVRSGAGWDRRSADAVAMNLWSSRGLTLRGFEVKVERRDLYRELTNPEKAEAVAQFCDEWWLATPPGLVKDEGFELPAGWGLMEATDAGLRTVRAAARREATPLTKGFVAQVLKHAQKMVARENNEWVRRADIEQELERAREQGAACIPREAQRAKDQAAALQRDLDRFEAGTGIKLVGDYRWECNAAQIVRAYRMGEAILGKYGHNVEGVVNGLRGAARAIADMQEALAPLAELNEKTKVDP